MKLTLSVKSCFFLLVTGLFLLQDKLQNWLLVFQYYDEAIAFLAIPALFFHLLRRRFPFALTKKNILFWVLFAIFWLSGWAGYFTYHYQPLLQTAMDSYVNLKFFLTIGTSLLIFDDSAFNFNQLKKTLWPVLNTVTLVLFLLCVADRIFGIFSNEFRGSFRAVKLFYSSYTVLAAHCVFLSAVYLWYYNTQQKKISAPLLMLCFIMYCTRRVKAIGAIACILIIYLLILRKHQLLSRKVKFLSGCILCLAAAAGFYQLVSYYYIMGTESARAMLTVAAPFVAADHFPFGSGWGTFGCSFSVDPYSPVYGMYRMAGIWGLSPNYGSFVSDTYWPMLLGQCGYFGFAAFIGVLVLFVQKVYTLKTDKSVFASAMLLLLYMLISSTSESTLANPIAVPFAFWLGFLFAERRNRCSDSGEMAV